MSFGTLTSILLGWLLGLLSPLIVDAIRKKYKEKEVRVGIHGELKDLRFRMAIAAQSLGSRFPTYDRAFHNWVIAVLENCADQPAAAKLLPELKTIAAVDDEQFRAVLLRWMAKPGVGINVKKFRLPYLDSKMGELGIFSEHVRARILEIRAQLEIFNEEVDEARMYHKMTFDLRDSESNHALACQNADASYKNLADRAKLIADKVAEIFSMQ